MIDAGRGSFELTGLTDEDVIGRPVQRGPRPRVARRGRRRRERRHQRRRRHRPDRDLAGVGGALARQAGLGQRRGRPAGRGGRRRLPRLRRRRRAADRPHPGGLRQRWARRRRHLFVLLFVLGLVVVSGAGHRQQADQARPRPQGRRRAGLPGPADRPGRRGQRRRHRTLDRDHPRADRQARRLRARGLAPRRRPRSRSACPDVTDAQRAIDQVGTTAQLYFYDWEPNLIGPERAIGGHPGQQPPDGAAQSDRRTLERRRPQRRQAREPAADLRRRLPDRLRRGAARLRTGAGRGLHELLGQPSRATTCSTKDEPHELIAGPELAKKDLYISPTGEKRARKDGIVVEVPAGTIVVSELPDRRKRPGRSKTPSRAGTRCKDDPALSGTDITDPKQEYRRIRPAERHLRLHRRRAARPSRKSPGRSPSAARRRRSARSAGEEAGSALRPLRGRPRQRSQDPADHQLRREPGRDRRPHRRPDLGRLHQHPARPRTWRRSCRSAPCRST